MLLLWLKGMFHVGMNMSWNAACRCLALYQYWVVWEAKQWDQGKGYQHGNSHTEMKMGNTQLHNRFSQNIQVENLWQIHQAGLLEGIGWKALWLPKWSSCDRPNHHVIHECSFHVICSRCLAFKLVWKKGQCRYFFTLDAMIIFFLFPTHLLSIQEISSEEVGKMPSYNWLHVWHFSICLNQFEPYLNSPWEELRNTVPESPRPQRNFLDGTKQQKLSLSKITGAKKKGKNQTMFVLLCKNKLEFDSCAKTIVIRTRYLIWYFCT